MKTLLHWLDPHRQGPWFFKWGFWSVVLVGGVFVWCCVNWDCDVVRPLMQNRLFYPLHCVLDVILDFTSVDEWGYLVCSRSCYTFADWWAAFSYSMVEPLFALVMLLACLRLKGGRWFSLIFWYCLGTMLYSAGLYAADARVGRFPLLWYYTLHGSSTGEVPGAWYYILKPLGLLNYDVIIGRTLIFLGILCAVLGVYSAYYYWSHAEQYLKEQNSPENSWLDSFFHLH